jgi:hypothetical protein
MPMLDVGFFLVSLLEDARMMAKETQMNVIHGCHPRWASVKNTHILPELSRVSHGSGKL